MCLVEHAEQVPFFFLREFAAEVMSIGFSDTPNYNKLRFILAKNLMNIGKAPSKYVDWLEGDENSGRLMDSLNYRLQDV